MEKLFFSLFTIFFSISLYIWEVIIKLLYVKKLLGDKLKKYTVLIFFILFNSLFSIVASSSAPEKTVINNNFGGIIKSISVTPNGDYIAVGATDNVVYLLSDEGDTIWSKKVNGLQLRSISVSYDGKYVIAAMGDGFYYVDKYSSRLLHESSSNLAYSTSLNQDGEYLAVGSGYTAYLLHDYGDKNWKYTGTSYRSDSIISSLDLTTKGDYLIAGSKDTHAYLFRCNGSNLAYLWKYKTGYFVHSVSISSDGNYIAVGTGFPVFLLDKNGNLLWERKPGNSINSVSISSDGNYIAVSAGSGIYLYNTKGDLLWDDNYPSSIDSVIISPNNDYILIGSGEILYRQILYTSKNNEESPNIPPRDQYVLNTDFIPSKSWWIDLVTGNPNVVIVVGAGASDENVRTANILSTAIINTGNSNIDPLEIVKLDIEFNPLTNNKNVLLIGGPIENSIVKDLVDMGASTVNWATSYSEWEWISDPLARGYDVLIISSPEKGLLARNGEFVVREVPPVPVSKTAPTQEYYDKNTMIIESSFYDLPDKDDDGVPDKYDPNPKTGGSEKSYTYFSWEYDGKLRTWELEIPTDTLEFYQKIRPENTGGWSYFPKFIVPNDKTVDIVASACENEIKSNSHWDYYGQVNFVSSLVQNLVWTDDETIEYAGKLYVDYPRYPTQTFFDRTGDCEDHAIAAAAILRNLDRSVELIAVYDMPGGGAHMAIGVWGHDSCTGTYLTKNGKKYFYIETTGPSDFGEFPQQWKGSTLMIIDND